MSGVCKQRIGHKFNLRESFLYRFTHFQNNSCIYICMYLASSPYCQEKLDLGNLGNVLLGYVHVRKTQTKINCSPRQICAGSSGVISLLPSPHFLNGHSSRVDSNEQHEYALPVMTVIAHIHNIPTLIDSLDCSH